MARYVDGFVTPVPTRHLAAYRRLARRAGKVWREHGALEYVECVADDVKPGKLTSFPRSVNLKKGEVVWLSYIVYASKRDRDRILKKVMADPRLADMHDVKSMPFDAKRMFWGGFRVSVEV
jgi:uncharacterized protein YbaA (DUF1428 family)